MRNPATHSSTAQRLALAVRGVVQGVGFRPFVYNAARASGLTGWVRNETDLVRIEVQGDPEVLEAFLNTLRHDAPPQAHIESIDVFRIDVDEPAGAATFEILPSLEHQSRRPAIPADLATCAECLAEIRDPLGRRYGYPFTNCTNCGPRWSIIEGLPYDRPRTSMRTFALCEACRAEYESPADRRFHAQPIACPECGPELRLLDTTGNVLARRDEALAAAAEAILAGRIIAMKGLGGFQLLVDATREEPVERLRQRKRRPAKPFAVMIGTLDETKAYCAVSDEEASLLTSPAAPIVLLRRWAGCPGMSAAKARLCESGPSAKGGRYGPDTLREGCDASTKHAHASVGMAPEHSGAVAMIANAVAPGNPELGVMLPYTPLHHLLMDRVGRPIVCTSGNLAEEPMVTGTTEALARLGRIADLLLTHNRPIVRPVDDSVVRCDSAGPVMLRRARGYAPLPIELGAQLSASHPASPVVLAVGGHLKNAVALRLGPQVVLGSHVGDLDSPQSWDVYRRAVDDLLSFFDVRPEGIVCDLHPDYLSTQHAERLARDWNVPLVRVQHHHAHAAACIAEHGLTGPVLGLAWDGAGYGPDGTVWGGEALSCEGATFRRVARLRHFSLPGGDQAVRRPRRSALGALFELAPELADRQAAEWLDASQAETLVAMLRRGVRSPRTSSMGRLFDAVAAVAADRGPWAVGCGPCDSPSACASRPAAYRLPPTERGDVAMSFEGEAAIALQFAADQDCDEAYPIALSDAEPMVADWEPMLRAVLSDRAAGIPIGRISARFHNALAALAVETARRAGCSQVVLSGGCFQNRLLTDRVGTALSAAGFNVYTHRKVPPGDGGIALGQAYVAGHHIPARSASEGEELGQTVHATSSRTATDEDAAQSEKK